jgi:hypothetical protein
VKFKKGTAFFDGSRFRDVADFAGADIAGDLCFDDARFCSKKAKVSLESAEIGRDVSLDKARFRGEARFDGIKSR